MGDDPPGEAASEGPCPAEALRVVAAAAWHVVCARRFPDFPRALTFLENVAVAAPDLVPFRHLIRLRLGLQAKIVMNMFQENHPPGKIYDAMDVYFPENEPPLHHSKATPQDLDRIQKSQEKFRILVLQLLSDGKQKEKYVQERLEVDYGEVFMEEVENLFCDYLHEMEQILPQPQFHMILEAARIQTPNQFPQPSATILKQYLSDVGYQLVDDAEPPTSLPHSSCTPCQSEGENPMTPPLSPQLGRSQSEDFASCNSEGDSHRQPWETSEDLVPDSESEGSTSPFQGEYQGTHLCALVPTYPTLQGQQQPVR
ncbi:TERF1-interacting nuclear factor 2 [Thamnophis elegans]|uniref:TERF1-interacting nuclear factor 2 n=1 Tax=Thamnophis elegans TaxID=35005 RepID=UPI001377D740|nr:TERF1-interacting nuclear factor 2 [Thamnophis elegans]